MLDLIDLTAAPKKAIVVCVSTLLVVAAILVALIAHTGAPRAHRALRSPVAPTARPGIPASALPGSGSPSTSIAALPRTDDPVQYAREVATALFDVAPASVTRTSFLRFWRGELPTVVYSDAAAKGLTLVAQNGDAVSNLTQWWIPSAAAWASEATEQTSSTLTITAVSVPDYWVNAVADGTFHDPGMHMERVMGVLTQEYGTDPSRRFSTTRAVIIDLGLLCGPTQAGGCRLLAPQQPPDAGN